MAENDYDDVFEAAAQAYGVDADVLKGIAYAESRFRPDIIQGKVRSPKGAIGMMQFMPETAKEYGINPLDPIESITGAAAYLRKSLDRFNGDYGRAIASYNWGPNRKAYERDDWVTTAPSETQNYLLNVLDYADKRRSSRPAPQQPEAPAPEEPQSALRQVADVPLKIGQGAVQGVRMIAEAFGAGSELGQNLRGAEQYIGRLMSAEAKKDEQEIGRIMQEAEDKGMGEQVKAAFRAFATAPVDILAQGLGTAAPALLSILGAKILGAGAIATTAISGTVGVGQGLGVVKGTIYEATKEALLKAGMSEEQAEARAQLAQSYGGENLDMILAGGALGGIAATTGIEKIAAQRLAREIINKSLAGRVVSGAVAEAAPEFVQAGQEQLAENIALQREGFDVPTMRGVAGAATLEGLAGAGLGAGFGVMPSGGTPERPEAEREIPQVETPPEVEQVSTTGFTEQDIEAASEGIPAFNLPIVRREVLGKTPEQLRAFVNENPEILEDDSPTSRIIRALLEPTGERDQPSMGIPVPSAGEPGVPGAQPAIPPERGGVAGVTADTGATVATAPSPTPTVTETPSGITTPEAEQTEAQRPQAPRIPVPPRQVDRFGEVRPGPIEGEPELTPEELAELGISTEPKAARVRREPKAPAIKPIENPENIGAVPDSVWQPGTMPETSLVTEGGRPFQSKTEAQEAKKLQPDMRLLKVPGGWVLTPKTEAQMEADRRAGERLGRARVGEAGRPLNAMQFIVDAGGLNRSAANNVPGVDPGRNLRVGNRFLVTPNGLSLEKAAELLQQNGYIDEVSESAAAEAMGNPNAYTAEGYNRIAELEAEEARIEEDRARMEVEARTEEFEEMGIEDDAEDYLGSGYETATDKVKAEVDEILARADELGIEPEAIHEAARQKAIARAQERGQPRVTDYDYYLAARQELKSVLQRSPEDRSQDTGQPGEAAARVKQASASGPSVSFTHRTDTEPGKGQVSGYYPGTYAYEDGVDAGPLASRGGANAFVGSIREGEIYTLEDAEALKREAANAGFDYRQASGSPEVQYLKSLGYKAMRRGPEIIVFDAKDADFTRVPDLELTPPSPEAQAEAERRAEQAPAEQEREQIRRESEVGAGQFRLEGGEGRQDISGTLFQQEGGGGFNPDPAESKIQQELEGKTVEQLTQWAVDNAPNRFAKAIAVKVQQRIAQQSEAGVSMSFVIEAGKTRSAKMYSARGMVNFTADPSKPLELTLTLNGAAVMENQSGYPSGMRYNTVLHELVHMATLTQINMLPSSHPLIKQLNELRNEIVKEFNYRARKGKLSDFEQRIYRRSINALSDPDEVIAWGLTDSDMQEFLASVKVGEQTLFDKFVDWARKILGLERPYLSALDEVIRTSDMLLAMPVTEIAKGVTDRGFVFGPEPSPATSTTEMVQGTLFQQESATPEPVREVQQSPNIQREAETIEQKAARENIFGEGVLSTWNTPTDTKILGADRDNIIYTLQNKQIDLKRVVDAIRNTGKDIAAKWDAYLQETLYHGRTAKRTQDYLKDELEKQVELMQKYGLTKEEVGTYLHNRHAEEANRHIAERNPQFPDGGSGINTEDAQAYLAGLKPEKRKQLEEVAKLIDDSVRTMQDELVRDGLESEDTINTWREMFQYYIPLNRVDSDFDTHGAMSQGAGYSTSGATAKSRTGSAKLVDPSTILANLAMQRERAIVRGEKNRVSNALFGLALQNPNPDFWLALDPSTDPVWKSIRLEQELRNELAQLKALLESGDVDANLAARYQREIDLTAKLLDKETKKAASALEKAKEQFADMGLSEADVRQIMMPPMQARYDKVRKKVVYEPNASVRNRYVLATRVNGQEKYVLFNSNNPRAKRMAEALKNMDGQQLGQALNIMAKITRWMAAVNTQYNPVFGAYNFLRDVQTGLLQINDTPIADKKSEVVAGTMPALKAIYQATRKVRKGEKVNTEWAKLWEEFQQEGGQTGFRDVFSQSDERAAAIQKMIDPSTWAESPLGKVFTAGGTLKMPLEQARKTAAPIFEWLSDYNSTMENAVRLSAYKAAKAKFISEGMSATDAKQRAAAIAKDLTVNFNRKGAIANQAGALYAFFNASVQGTTRMFQLLNSPIGRKIAAGAFLLGVLQAVTLAAAGFDDEEPADFVKQRNYIIPTGDGKYVAFPMPLGFNVLPNTSRVLTEWALSGFEDTSRRVLEITDAMFDMFNPIGNAGWSYQSISPTAFDPLVALTENKDWTGKQIAREDFNRTDPTPGYTRSKDNANWLTQTMAEFLNTVSGGDQERKGILSPTAEQLEYLIGQATGGVGREAMKAVKTGQAIINDEELPSYNVPLFGRFYGNVTGMAPVSNKFYRNMTELNIHKRAIERIAEEGGDVRGYLEKNPEAVLHKAAGTQYREVQKLRKARIEMLNRGDKANAKRLEEQIKTRMDTLNKLFDEKRK